MKPYLTYRTVDEKVSIQISADQRSVGVFIQGLRNSDMDYRRVVEFSIIDLWDLLRDNLIICDVGQKEQGLFRRKWEALIATRESMKFDLNGRF
uniref:Uncharacterized protein n=1 Tax=viral metagenome TaxID=1070528 RepID=A0A6H1ZTS7_9ZZZZ